MATRKSAAGKPKPKPKAVRKPGEAAGGKPKLPYRPDAGIGDKAAPAAPRATGGTAKRGPRKPKPGKAGK